LGVFRGYIDLFTN